MSKKLLSVLAVVAILAVMSTNAFALDLEVGAKGGINLGNMWGSDKDSLGTDTSMRTGFLGGAFLGMTINESVGARLEVDYAQRGQKTTFDTGSGSEDITFKLDYVEIALYGVGMFPVNETVAIHAFAGPYVGFLSKAEVADGTTEDIKDFITSTDFGVGVGAGVCFMATEMLKILVEGQYNIGLMSVDDTDDDLTIKNQGIGFTAGVAVPLSSGSSSGGGM
jgi:opacity protein-like surface antigen